MVRENGRCGRWNTAPGFGLDKVVLRAAAETRYSTYTIHDSSDLKKLGTGFLAVAAPSDELRDRHIALMGTSMLNWGAAGVTCWGNRIFVRNNDYLWCLGDPAKPFAPPEKFLVDGQTTQSAKGP